MTDEEHAQAIEEALCTKSKLLLQKVVDWHDNNFMEQSFAEIMAEIREHLEELDNEEI